MEDAEKAGLCAQATQYCEVFELPFLLLVVRYVRLRKLCKEVDVGRRLQLGIKMLEMLFSVMIVRTNMKTSRRLIRLQIKGHSYVQKRASKNGTCFKTASRTPLKLVLWDEEWKSRTPTASFH